MKKKLSLFILMMVLAVNCFAGFGKYTGSKIDFSTELMENRLRGQYLIGASTWSPTLFLYSTGAFKVNGEGVIYTDNAELKILNDTNFGNNDLLGVLTLDLQGTVISSATFATIAIDTTTLGNNLTALANIVYQLQADTGTIRADLTLLQNIVYQLQIDTATLGVNLASEISSRIAGDDALGLSTGTIRTDLTAETASRIAGDSALGQSTGTIRSDLTSETNSRIAGDEALGVSTGTIAGDLATETASRIAGDSALGQSTGTIRSDLTTETSERIAGDYALGQSTANLQVQIDVLSQSTSSLAGTVYQLQQDTATLGINLASETASRISADFDLGNDTATLRVDLNALESNFDDHKIAIALDTTTIAGNLSTEESARTAGDNALGQSTGTLRTDLISEINARIAGDSALGQSTGTLRVDLTAETNARIAGDDALGVSTGTLRTDLTAETNARIAQDIAIAVSTNALKVEIDTKLSTTTAYADFAQLGAVNTFTQDNYIDGDVVIGTTTKYAKITIADHSSSAPNNNILALFNTRGSGSPDSTNLAMYAYNDNLEAYQNGKITIKEISEASGFEDSEMQFYTVSSGAVTQKVVIDKNGNVGIGTLIPGGVLDISNGTNAVGDEDNPAIRIGNASGGTYRLGFWTTTERGVIDAGNGDEGLSIEVKNSNEVVRISTNGYVGIGTVAPAEALDVIGNIAVNGTVDGIDINGNANAVSLATSSLRTDLTAETASRIAGDNALGLSTGTIRSDLTAETNARIAQDTAIAVSTNALAVEIDTKLSTTTAYSDFALLAGTNTFTGENYFLGNIGIGLINPGAKIDILQTENDQGIIINTNATSQSALLINANSVTNGFAGIDIDADGLTSGTALKVFSNSPNSTADAEVADFVQVNPTSSATVVNMRQEGFGKGLFINHDGNGRPALHIDAEHTSGSIVDIDYAGGNAFDIDFNGNVGIGTVDPDETLDVNGTIKGSYLKVNSTFAVSAQEPFVVEGYYEQIRLIDTQSKVKWSIGTWADADLWFGFDYLGAESRPDILYLEKGGNVGMGTNAPLAKLEIKQDNVDEALMIDQNANEQSIYIDAESTTQDVIDISAIKLTTGKAIDIDLGDLTTGYGLYMRSASTEATTAKLMQISELLNNPDMADRTGTMILFQNQRYITSTQHVTDNFNVVTINRRYGQTAGGEASTHTVSGAGLFIDTSMNPVGIVDSNAIALKISGGSNSSSDVYAIDLTLWNNSGSGLPGGIDLSQFSTGEPLFKMPTGTLDVATGGIQYTGGNLGVKYASGVEVKSFRGSSDTDITGWIMYNADGEACYIYPNATQDGIIVSGSQP